MRIIQQRFLYVFGGKSRGDGAIGVAENPGTKMTKEVLVGVVSFVDDNHSRGKTVVVRDVMEHVFDKHTIRIDRITAWRTVQKIGLSWGPIARAKRTYAS